MSVDRHARRQRHRRACALLVAVAASLLAACGIDQDDSPRDIDPGNVDVDEVSSGIGAAATGSGRIFLLAPDVPGVPDRLQSVARDVSDDPSVVVATLLAGPNEEELGDQLRTALPSGLEAHHVLLRAGGVLAVDLSAEILTLSGDALIAALAQLVHTVAALPSVDSVLLTVEGKSTLWPSSTGELTSAALTVYDYPGWDPSSQPAYPGTPPSP